MDWLSECESCLQFRSMQFPQSQPSNGESTQPNLSTLDNEDIKIIEENISYLMDQMDKLTEASSEEDVGLSKNEWIIDKCTNNKKKKQTTKKNNKKLGNKNNQKIKENKKDYIYI